MMAFQTGGGAELVCLDVVVVIVVGVRISPLSRAAFRKTRSFVRTRARGERVRHTQSWSTRSGWVRVKRMYYI